MQFLAVIGVSLALMVASTTAARAGDDSVANECQSLAVTDSATADFAKPEPPKTESAKADSSPLNGHIEYKEGAELDLTGIWKAHVLEFRRHPKLYITNQVDDRIEGVYSGLIGKFPVSGVIDRKNSSFKLYVDFSRSKIMRKLTSSKSPVAVMDGHFTESTLFGIASLPEFGDKAVHIEAKRMIAQN